MISPIQNPVFKCSICGKEEMQKGAVSTGIPSYWACRECRGKMKKITVTRTIYEDGYVKVSGECSVCGQFPCRHANASGEFLATTHAPLKFDLVCCSSDVRSRWLMRRKKG